MSTAKSRRPKQIKVKPLTSLAAWKQLKSHAREMAAVHLRTLFADDPQRGERMTAEGAGLFLDYSKNRANDETLKILLALAEESKLREHTEAMFRGRRSTLPRNGQCCILR